MVENRREYAVRWRTRLGMRVDPAWVDHVAETGRDGGMTLNIPLTDDELADLNARSDRTVAIGAAVDEAALPSDAGLWIEQAAGGLVHVQLAHATPEEQATAEAIITGRHAVIDLVEHSTRDLERVHALVVLARHADPEFADAIVGYGIRAELNTLLLELRHDRDPAIPEDLREARSAGTLTIEYTTARWDAD